MDGDYWHFLDKGLSVAQNIDELFFAGHDKLENEFGELYESLFQSPEPYVEIVATLATKKAGMTRDELCGESSLKNSGKLSECLKDLERCGFIRKYVPLGRKNKGCVYQLIDNYTLFYYKFVKPNQGVGKRHWTKMLGTSEQNAWAGLAFERLCLQHTEQIKEALRIGGVHANIHAWRSPQAQIDLLIDRDDGIINLCEMKFASDEFEVTAGEDRNMKRKITELKKLSGTRKSIHVTYVTTYGLKENSYAKEVQSSVDLDGLFYR